MQYGFGYGAGRRWRRGNSVALSEISFEWREGAPGGVVAEDVDAALPVEVADISAPGASTISIFSDPDSKFDIVDNGNGTAVLRLNASIAYASATSHSFTIEASDAAGSVFYAGELSLYAVVIGQAPTAITFNADAVASGQTIPDDADTSLPLLLGTLTANGSHPITMTETADGDGKFSITDHGNGTASLYLTGSIDSATDTSHSVTVQASNSTGSFSQGFTFTVANTTGGTGIDEGDGAVVGDPNFSQIVTPRNVAGTLRLAGKNSAEAKFLYNLGVPVASRSYTIKYDPDFTRLSLQGKKAFVGFGFKETAGRESQYHFVGLKGDGTTGLNKTRISGTVFKNSGYTETSAAAAAHGTQAGPNWARLVVSANGQTYKFYTSADGVAWTEEYTGITPSPLTNVTGAAEFGIAALFEDDDRGAFSIAIQAWISESVASVPVNTGLPAISATAPEAGQTITDTNADTWTGSPTSFARQWMRDGVAISGATGSTYLTTSADLESTITLSKTASNAAGTSAAAVSNGIGISNGTPHRYWRVLVDAVQSGTTVTLALIQMREHEFGPNVCAGGTVIKSAESAGYGASEAFNNSLADGSGASNQEFWATTPAVNAWIGYDFGSGNAKAINAVDLWARHHTDRGSQMVKDFRVQYSDDGSSWTTAWTVTSQTGWRQREHRKFVNPGRASPSYSGSPHGSHTYWRVLTTGVVSGTTPIGVVIGELQFRAVPGVSQTSTGGTASANSEFSAAWVAGNAFNGDGGTSGWSGANTFPEFEHWLQYQHASAREVAQLQITARGDTIFGQEPDYFQLWYSDNGTTWTHAADFNDPASGWSVGETRTFTDSSYV